MADQMVSEERVLVMAPFGQDASMAADILAGAQTSALVCDTLPRLCAELSNGAGALLVAYEALSEQVIDDLVHILDQQPPWSDIPILVLMPVGMPSIAKASQLTFDRLRNVTILQRPIRIAILVSSVQAALRERRRQYLVRTLLDELRRSSQTKDAFLATVTHELRTPLSAIMGWTAVAKRSAQSPLVAEALEKVDRNSRVLSKLVEDLLDLARVAHGQYRLETTTLNLADVVRAAVDAVRPTAETKRVQLHFAYDSDVPLVVGDGIRLQQVVWNLLWNAVKFTPEHGQVRVHLRMELLPGDRLQHPASIELEVSDTGGGIAPDLLPHIFDPFRRADTEQIGRSDGLGLGLSIVKHLVELHGGSITASSAGLERGATFVVRLPCAEQPVGVSGAPLLASTDADDAVSAL